MTITKMRIVIQRLKAWIKRLTGNSKTKEGENSMMSSLFLKCVQFVFDREGREYENNPADSGGATKFGISQKAYPDISIEALTEEQASAIYYRDYWIPLHCDDYEQRLALSIFDTGVNQGVFLAQSILAEVVGSDLTAEKYLFKRLRHYVNLCEQKPNMKVFLIDWVLRVVKITEFTF